MNEENKVPSPVEILEEGLGNLSASNVYDNESIAKWKEFTKDAEERISKRNEHREVLQTAIDTLNGDIVDG